MTKEAIIKALELCDNGEQMLQFLEGLSDYQQQSWITLWGAQNAPFLCHIDKDYAFFILKKVLLMYMRCLYVLHNVCGKVLIMCGKVCVLMYSDLVILACSLSPLRENVKRAAISFARDWQRKNISDSYKYWLARWQYSSHIL